MDRNPLVLVSGQIAELPAGDTLPAGATSNSSSNGGTPTYTAGTGMGTSPTLNMPGDNLDLSGTLTFTSGSSPSANALLVRVTYSQTFARAPRVVLYWANQTGLTAFNKLYIGAQTTTYFEVWVYTTTNIGAGTFSINYIGR